MESCVLITNLQMIHVRHVHLTAHALLLIDNGPKSDGQRYGARGFGTEAVDERFSFVLPGIEYVFERDPETAIAKAFNATTMSTHGTLRVVHRNCFHEGRPEIEHREAPSYEPCSCTIMQLDCCSNDGREIDFERFDFTDRKWTDPTVRQRFWDRLHAKVCAYWSSPFVRVSSQVRLELARKATAGDLR